MMVPKSLLLASAALLSFTSAADAQQQTKVRRVTKPLVNATLDLQTGMYTIGSAVNEKGASVFNTEISLFNTDFSGFVGIDSQTCEWYSSANKGTGRTGGKSQIMTSFLFAYCSSALSTASGGVGGSAIITFRDGYTGPSGGAPSGPATAQFNVSGMPANTNSSSFFGGFNCFFLRVRSANNAPASPARTFEGGQVMPDGQMGWGWNFADLATDGTLAHTFPFLACVQSCSGVGPDQTGGMVNYVDQYCPTGSLLATFTFGTTTTYSSVSMEIREAEAITGATVSNNGTGVNPAGSLANIAGTPTLGGFWKMSMNCAGADPSKIYILRISFLPPIPPSPTPFGEGLINGGGPGNNFFGGHGGAAVTFPPGGPGVQLPLDLAFQNSCYGVQALCGDSPKGFFTNAVFETVGSN